MNATTRDPREMLPGPELDALVMEAVGYEADEDDTWCAVFRCGDTVSAFHAHPTEETFTREDAEKKLESPPPNYEPVGVIPYGWEPSVDANHALDAAERFGLFRRYFTAPVPSTNGSEPPVGYYCLLSQGEDGTWFVSAMCDVDYEMGGSVTEAPTAALSICRAIAWLHRETTGGDA